MLLPSAQAGQEDSSGPGVFAQPGKGGVLPGVRLLLRRAGEGLKGVCQRLGRGTAQGTPPLFGQAERQGAQVIMVTSTNPGEGKTTVSANLALALAAQGSRTILVDADLRKPSQKALFGIDTPSQGLAELIAEKSDKITPLAVPDSELLLLSGDKSADQPQRFLSSPRMKKIFLSLREQMDYIIVDTPPCGFLSDAATLSSLVDGVVYVVRQDFVSRPAIADAMQLLAATDVRFLGCVLNNTERSTTRYGYGYRGGYGSKYGGYGYASKYYGKQEAEASSEEFVK